MGGYRPNLQDIVFSLSFTALFGSIVEWTRNEKGSLSQGEEWERETQNEKQWIQHWEQVLTLAAVTFRKEGLLAPSFLRKQAEGCWNDKQALLNFRPNRPVAFLLQVRFEKCCIQSLIERQEDWSSFLIDGDTTHNNITPGWSKRLVLFQGL